MAAAIWSCPTGQMLDMPLATFVRFCQNHGLLQVFDRPLWRTVKGGSREYVNRIAAQLRDVRLACPVRAVKRRGAQLHVVHDGGIESLRPGRDGLPQRPGAQPARRQRQRVAARSTGRDPLPGQSRAAAHRCRSLLPRDRRLWSAWNYFAGRGEPGAQPVGVSYLINRLQPLPFKTPVVVTLNPAANPTRPT